LMLRARDRGNRDPLLILAQILSLQSVSYFSYSLLLYTSYRILGDAGAMPSVFDWRVFGSGAALSAVPALVWLVQMGVSAGLMYLWVHPRLFIDFGLSFGALHFALCWLYTQALPLSASWWAIQTLGCAVLAGGAMGLAYLRHSRPPLLPRWTPPATAIPLQPLQPLPLRRDLNQ